MYIDKSCFEMKILNNLARNCVCLSYSFKHVRIYIPRHPLSSASLEQLTLRNYSLLCMLFGLLKQADFGN